MRRLLMIVVALGLVATGAQGQLVVGNDQSGTATMYYIDVNTGVATPLYASSSSDAKPWGMAYDPSTNTLYWNNGSTLFSAPFSELGITPTTLGTMMFNSATVNFVALGFRNNKLLGTRNIATEAVYEIDPVTLEATQVYVYPSAFDFGGIDVDVTTDLLFGLNDATGGGEGRGLYEIDTMGQTTTFRAPYPAGETDIDGLAVYNGLAYYVTDGPNTTQMDFYVFDIASGSQVGTLPSPFTGSGTFAAAAYVAGPGPTSTEPTTWGQIKGLYR